MKKIITMLIILTLVITISGCASTSKGAQQSSVSNIGYDYTMNSSLDLSLVYKNIDTLIADAEIIVEGKVLETNSIVVGNNVLTKFKLQVTNSLKDTKIKGQIMELASVGGIVSVEDFLKANKPVEKSFEINTLEKLTANEKKTKKIKATMGEFPLIESGKEYIIFGKKDHLASGESIYVPLGVAQGVFEIDITNNIIPFSRYGNEIVNNKESKENFINNIIKVKNTAKSYVSMLIIDQLRM
ncbi:hypothetical protein [Candidatus Clostridium radicumherbarum]|uniref:Lipoprotein n=1 Tax=Candidatus Clostridium radicumherbarum TaxID=3381662 RepID=A0ABW8TU52_9CLOT